MRGKKIDTEFLTNFISQCIEKSFITPDQMIVVAQNEINEIEKIIKQAEDLKIRRGKLLDVVCHFKKPIKNNKEEIKILSLFQISYPHICKFICDQLKEKPKTKDQLTSADFSEYDINFCIKQLSEHKVINKSGHLYLRGEMYNDYVKCIS